MGGERERDKGDFIIRVMTRARAAKERACKFISEESKMR